MYKTFKYIFCNVNLNSIQETYPNISVYYKIIIQFVEKTNLKYGLDLKFTKLEAQEVGLWAKTFQEAGHDEDQQLTKQLALLQQSEPPQQQPQHTQQSHQGTLHTDKLPLTKQWAETDWLTSMAAQWSNHSHSTPMLSPVAQEHYGQYRHQTGQSQHNVGYVGTPEFYPPQVTGNGRFSQLTPYYDSGINIFNALEGYSLWQVLMQMVMNSIQEFNDTDREATIPWLDHIKAIARKTGSDPLEIGMSKLKGTALWDVNAISKEGNLSYFQFCQLLIKHYSNVPYVSDALNAYAHLLQGESKMVTWYVARAKVTFRTYSPYI